MRSMYRLLHVRILTSIFVLSSAAWASTWYVDGVNGSDSNDCKSSTTACKTVGHVISLAASGDTIKVAAATYTENLSIGINLTILGSGATTTILDGGGVGTVLTISSASTHVNVSGVTITHGQNVSGGGISNAGTLTIIASAISGNVAYYYCPGPFHLCWVSGGGVLNEVGGRLTISNSTLSDNRSKISGYCSVFYCHSIGGAILNRGTLALTHSTVIGNSVSGRTFVQGAGIYNGGGATISNSTISNNSGNLGQAGGIYSRGTLTVKNSTLSGNSSSGIIGVSGTVVVINSTFSGNVDGIDGSSGGKVLINSSTIAASTRNGVSNVGGSMVLQNTIVANNSLNCAGTFTSHGYNLSSDASCNFSGPGDLNNIDPHLMSLQYNGGPTQTMALPSGSPAVDAGNPTGCTDDKGHLLKTDQRGMPRPNPEDTGGCDIGAYELESD